MAVDTRLVGDSLTAQTDWDDPDFAVNGLPGRALYDNIGLISSLATYNTLVVALGSNDVNQMRPVRIWRVAELAPIVVITTVKVNGVTPFYGERWREYARRWNTAVHESGAVVADWNAKCQGHPGWFLSDGLHLTRAGEINYAQLIENTVTQAGG